MQTETSPVVANLISSVLSEMLDENGGLRKAADTCCCAPACAECYTLCYNPKCTYWPEG